MIRLRQNEVFYKVRNSLMHTFSVLSAIEIFSLELGIGFPILSDTSARIILNISYAFFASWIFFFLNIIIPKKIEDANIKSIFTIRVYYFINRIDSFLAELTIHFKSGNVITRAELREILLRIQEGLKIDEIESWKKLTLEMIEQINLYPEFIDPIVYRRINDIGLMLVRISLRFVFEGLDFDQTHGDNIYKLYKDIISLNEYMKEEFKILEKEYALHP
jgi:hypothetical protein